MFGFLDKRQYFFMTISWLKNRLRIDNKENIINVLK